MQCSRSGRMLRELPADCLRRILALTALLAARIGSGECIVEGTTCDCQLTCTALCIPHMLLCDIHSAQYLLDACQYLYFCTSKASKLSTTKRSVDDTVGKLETSGYRPVDNSCLFERSGDEDCFVLAPCLFWVCCAWRVPLFVRCPAAVVRPLASVKENASRAVHVCTCDFRRYIGQAIIHIRPDFAELQRNTPSSGIVVCEGYVCTVCFTHGRAEVGMQRLLHEGAHDLVVM